MSLLRPRPPADPLDRPLEFSSDDAFRLLLDRGLNHHGLSPSEAVKRAATIVDAYAEMPATPRGVRALLQALDNNLLAEPVDNQPSRTAIDWGKP